MAIEPQSNAPSCGGSMSEAEYLWLDKSATDARYEYIDGVARLMAGGTIEADEIGFNVRTALKQQFLNGPCKVFGPDVQVLIGTKQNGNNEYYYPDCTISCDVSDRSRGNKLIRSPHTVIEVLSPGTEKDDRGTKLAHYQALPTLYEIVLVSQFAPHVEVYHRVEVSARPLWEHTIYGSGQQVILPSMDIEIALDELYTGVNFDEPLPADLA
ncbi:MAG: Uma2 family endonuclease [Ktedonobacteraceae bacterium]